MARADLLVSLVRAVAEGDKALFRETLQTVIEEEREKQHHILAKRLSQFLSENGSAPQERAGSLVFSPPDKANKYLLKSEPRHRLEDLVLPDVVRQSVTELVDEQRHRDRLRSYGIEPRHRVLLAGPPGNGKTSLAEALAERLMVPLFNVRYETVIGSYLGETSSRLKSIFEYVKERECVLFFDEFDTIGKERGDVNETGEIKRVVSSLLLQIDRLPSHVVVVTASNHPELLDRAVWRRFQLRLHLPAPDQEALARYLEIVASQRDVRLGMPLEDIADRLEGVSFAEAEEFWDDVLRRLLLSENVNPQTAVRRCLREWEARYTPDSH